VRELQQRALQAGARYVVLVGFTRVGAAESYDVQLLPAGDGPPLARAWAPDPSQAGRIARQAVRDFARLHARPAQELEPAPSQPLPRTGRRVSEIRVEGNRRIDADAIRAVLSTQVGQPLSSATVGQDIRRIYELGFFRDVDILATDMAAGVLVTVRVEENPVIRRVTITGNDNMGSDDITEQLTLTIGSTIDYPLILENQARIEAMYQAKGFYLVDVSYELEDLGPDAVSVDFNVNEGRKLRLRQVNFHGNEAFSDRALRRKMKTKPWGWASPVTRFWDHSGLYAEPIFYQDLDTITRSYMDDGFIRVQVSEPQVEVDKKGLTVNVVIEEGPQYTVGVIDVLGDDTIATEDLLDSIDLEPGAVFSRSTLSADVELLRRRYADRGFFGARVRPRTDVDPDALTVDVIFEVEKNELFFIERIEVSGNTRSRDEVVRRELSISEGELYSDTAIERSRARVRRLGFFEEVSVETQQIDEQTVGVTIDVVERPTGSFSFGAGFGSADGFLVNASIRQDNLFGRGWTVAMSADLGSQTSFGSLRFSNPYILGTIAGFSTAFSYSEREFQDFDQEVFGFSLDLSYPLDEGETRISTGYGFSSRSVSGFAEFQAASLLQREDFQDDTTTSLASLSLRRDTRDDIRFPRAGYVSGAAAEFAGLGGVSNFVRLEGRTTHFWNVRRFTGFNSTFVTNSRIGYVFDMNSISDFDLPDCNSDFSLDCLSINNEVDQISKIDDDLKLPLTERYFLGGIGPFQVRGFEQRSLGPRRAILGPVRQGSPKSFVFTTRNRDNAGVCQQNKCNSINDTDIDDFDVLDETDVIGGNKMFLLNFDFQFPLSEELGLMGILFFDMGNAFSENESFNPADLRFGTGVGAQWFSPFGPILVYLGFPLDPLEDEDGSVFEFSLGGSQF
jgi:outer membrane protein insertion porin family